MSLQIKGPSGKRIAILHFPKASGTWLRTVLQSVTGINCINSPCKSGFSRHYGLEHWEGNKPDLVFTLIREPASWIESWWKYNTTKFPVFEVNSKHPCRWSDVLVYNHPKAKADFQIYVKAMCEDHAKEFNEMYKIGTKGVDYVYRMENAMQMLEDVCEAAGRPTSGEKLARAVPPQNVSKAAETKWTQPLKRKFREATKQAKTIYSKAL